MSLESRLPRWLAADACVSWVVALPGLIDPDGVATFFGAEEPAYGFVVRLWCGLVFMFGCASWELRRDVRGKAALLKYVWIAKAIAAVSVTAGHLAGAAPPSLMALNVVANLAWIPPLLSFDLALRRARQLED